MKKYAVPLGAMIVGGMLLSGSASAGEQTVLKTRSDKENYTTGVEFVRSLQKRGGSVNLDLVIQATNTTPAPGRTRSSPRCERKSSERVGEPAPTPRI